MTTSNALDDSRVRDMTENLQRYIDADPDEDGGIHPVGLEGLEGFLEDLTVNILDTHKMECPLVQPAEDGNILLVWREPADSLRVDVHLPSRQAEHRILHDLVPQGKGQHTLKGEGWKTLSRKVSEWKKSTTTRNSTG